MTALGSPEQPTGTLDRTEISRRYRERNRDQFLISSRTYYAKTRDDPSRKRWYKKYYEVNRERIRKQQLEYRLADYESWLARQRETDARRRAKKPTNKEDRIDIHDYRGILYKDVCCFCGRPCEHIDHIEPLARDGFDIWDNLSATCAKCNLSKGDKRLLRYLYDRASTTRAPSENRITTSRNWLPEAPDH